MRFLRQLAAYFRASWGAILEYRVSLVIWMATGALPLVMMGVWLSLSAGGPIGGYSSSDFVAYYLAAIFVRQMTAVWVAWELDRQIRLGELSPLLLRPINPLWDHISVHLADKVFRLPILLPLLALAALISPGQQYHLTMGRVALFLLATFGAWAMVFTSHYCCGLLAFWISQATALSEIWYGIRMLLSGVVAPLALFPPGLARVAQGLPFRFMLSFPVEILMGHLSAGEIGMGFLWQGMWLTAFSLLLIILWRRGLRVYSAVGA
jgi:ABC-2 type transport system permease protein